MSEPAEPRILACTDDVFLLPRLEDVAARLGFRVEAADLEPDGFAPATTFPLTEPLEGEAAALVRSIASDPPALILVDLASSTFPWRRWIQTLKTSSATRRIPVLAFGPHVDESALGEARALGADRVVTRGEFHRRLADLLQAEAQTPDHQGLAEGCSREMSAAARQGIEAYLQGAFFEAHEHLERAVLSEPGVEGTVYRALLHLAVACLHFERGNQRGARKMLLRMGPWLAPLPDECRGVDVPSLRRAGAWLQGQLDAGVPPGAHRVRSLEPPTIDVRDQAGS